MSSKALPCRYFLKGDCQKGDSCERSHSRLAAKNANVCSFYLAGHCAFGSSCKKSHVGKPSSSSASSSSEAPDPQRRVRTIKKKPVTSTREKGKEKAPDVAGDALEQAAGEAPEPATGPSENHMPCSFFQIVGTCANGDNCQFPHILKPVGRASGSGGVSAMSTDSSRSKMSRSKPSTDAEASSENESDSGVADLGDEQAQIDAAFAAAEWSDESQGHGRQKEEWPESYSSDSDHNQPQTPSEDRVDMAAGSGPFADNDHIDALSEGGAGRAGQGADDREQVVLTEAEAEDDMGDFYASGPNPNGDEGAALTNEQKRQQPVDIEDEHFADHDQHDLSEEPYPEHQTINDEEQDPNDLDTDPYVEEEQDQPLNNENEYSDKQSMFGDNWDKPKPSSTQASFAPSPLRFDRKFQDSYTSSPLSTGAFVTGSPIRPQSAPQYTPHWSQYADPTANSLVPFCKTYAQGACLAGASCRFRHALTPAEYTMLFHEQQPNLLTLDAQIVPSTSVSPPLPVPVPGPTVLTMPPAVQQAVVVPYYSPTVMQAVSVGVVPSVAAPAQAKTTSAFEQECKFYPIGACRNGDRCPYKHTQHPPSTQYNSGGPGRGRSSNAQNKQFDNDRFDGPCKYFTQYGTCKRGNECKFRHGESSDESKPSVESEPAADGWATWGNHHNGSADADDPWADPPKNTEDANSGDTEKNTNEVDDGWGDSWKIQNDNDNVDLGWGPPALKKSGDSEWDDPAESSASNVDYDSKGKTSSSPWARQTNVCRQWEKRGQCKYGPSCKFAHDMESEAGPANKSSAADDDWPPPPAEDSMAINAELQETFAKKKNTQTTDDSWQGSAGHEKDNNSWWSLDQTPQEVQTEEPIAEEPTERYQYEDDLTNEAASELQTKDACKTFLENGFCTNIKNCELNHPGYITPKFSTQDSAVESSPDHDSVTQRPLATSYMMQSEVSFGPALRPQQILAAGDSTKVIISNLPVDITEFDVEQLSRPFGDVLNVVRLADTVDACTMQAEFQYISEAYQVYRNLQGHEFRAMNMSTTIPARVTPVTKFVGQKLYIEATWPRAHRSAWAHYKNIKAAKAQAEDLNVILNGRLIKASYSPPKKGQKNQPFAVHFANLSASTTKADIEGITTGAMLITMDPPIIETDPIEDVKSTFAEFGELEQFDPMPPTTESMATAFITYKSEAHAIAAVKDLRARPLPYLGKKILILRGVHYTRYCIPRRLFDFVKSEIDELSTKSSSYTVQYNDHPNGTSVWLRLFATFDDQTQFATANKELRRILHATTLVSEGRALWDSYFEISSGMKALEQIELKVSNVLLICDQKAKRILVYGSSDARTQVQAAVMKLLSKVQAQLHEIALMRPKLNPLINGGFATLQSKVGQNRVVLDVFNSLLIVRGSEEDVAKAGTCISELQVGNVKKPSAPGTCQICHHKAARPINLSCRHAYCTACLQNMLLHLGSAPFQCVHFSPSSDGDLLRCPAYVDTTVLKELPTNIKDTVMKSTVVAHVHSRPHEFFFCPSMGCNALHRVREEGVNIKCTACAAELCTFCRCLAHIGIPCSAGEV